MQPINKVDLCVLTLKIGNSILYCECTVKFKKKGFGEQCAKYDPIFIYVKKSI